MAVQPPQLSLAFTLSVALAPPIDFGNTAKGHLRYIPITGGTVTGPKLTGIVTSGGGDWNTRREDGISELRAEYSILVRSPESDGVEGGDVHVHVVNDGIGWVGRNEGGAQAFTARTTPRFEVAQGSPLRWLQERYWLGALRRVEGGGAGVIIDVFEVL